MKNDSIIKETNYWFDKFEVTVSKKQKIKSLSKGNQQKIQLICSLIHKPSFLILDEPFSGLDPINFELLINGILELKKSGTTIIFSSHNMVNVEQVCDELIMLKKGSIVLKGDIESVRESFGRTNIFLESSLDDKIFNHLDEILSIEKYKSNIRKITVSNPDVGKEIFDIVSKEGYISMFSQQPPSLEEIFKFKVGETVG
ncbi:AAA domain-containing protein, putative AbiEii toxin, Type IV TA system [Alkalibacterium gilvum]|uniref:AAA domain-containing protein, putative AbiEii toxin, Type IV TA system n=1 Tax=Alkalibacterium gilvum TaxID=1130080 RepID=A0A1H6U3K1_9LACT|nr:AAA domain-containing protein, putative AbiEii toxin, Type IV TA system [Alkalibacterium gilvum]